MKTFTTVITLMTAAASAVHTLSPRERLQTALFDGYSADAIPVKGGNQSLRVEFGVALVDADLDDRCNLQTLAWYRVQWQDYRLRWDPEEFQNVTSIRVDPPRLWTPDIVLYNEAYGKISFKKRSQFRQDLFISVWEPRTPMSFPSVSVAPSPTPSSTARARSSWSPRWT